MFEVINNIYNIYKYIYLKKTRRKKGENCKTHKLARFGTETRAVCARLAKRLLLMSLFYRKRSEIRK